MGNQNKPEEFKLSVTHQVYRGFIADIFTNIYLKINHFQNSGLMISEIEKNLDSKYSVLYQDFFEADNMINISSLGEFIDKLIQGEIPNGFCFCLFNYQFSINTKICALALAISFENYKKLQLKDNGESTYTKSSLPKLTYIFFGGFYSELNLHLLYQYSDNVQCIMIYDKSTGGPSFEERVPKESTIYQNYSQQEQDYEGDSIPKTTISLAKMSKNILLLPLDCSAEKIDSKYIYDLFTNVVNRAIRFFNPEVVLISYPFTFHPDETNNQANKNPIQFSLKASTWTKILHDLCTIMNYKVLVVPYQPCYEPKSDNNVIRSEKNGDWELMRNDGEILSVYNQVWNPSYLEECITGSMEVLSGIKKFKRGRKFRSHITKYNHQYEKQLSLLLKEYSLWNNLYSNLFSEETILTMTIKYRLLSDYIVGTENFIRSNPSLGYNKEIPFLQQDDTFEKQDTIKKYKEIHSSHTSNQILLFDPKKFESNTDDFLSWVNKFMLMYNEKTPIYRRKESQYIVDYSTQTSDSKCSNQIFYFDSNTREWIKPQILQKFDHSGPEEKFVPRHSVSYNNFESSLPNSKDIICVFRGVSDEINLKKKWRISKNIEYNVMDFEVRVFRLKSVGRRTLFNEKISWMPYTNSYSLQIYNQILILGGQRSSVSFAEANSVTSYYYNVEKECFTKTEIVKTKGSRKSSAFKRDPDKEICIADTSRNILQDKDRYLVIFRSSKSEHLISVIIGSSAKLTVEIFPCFMTNTAFHINPDAKFLTLGCGITANNSSSTATQDCQSHQESEGYQSIDRVINMIQAELPDVRVLLYFLTKYIQTVLDKKGSNLSSDIFLDAIYQIFNDPLFKAGEFKKLIAPICDIFPIILLDSRMKPLLQEVGSLHRSNNKELLRKTILEIKPKKKLLRAIHVLIEQMISCRELQIQTILLFERIFGRNSIVRNYHAPEHTKSTIKWFSKDFRELLSSNLKIESNIDYSQEDSDILRDCIECLGKLLVYTQNHRKTQQSGIYKVEEIEKESFWENAITEISFSTEDQTGDKNLIDYPFIDFRENPLDEENIKDVLIELLAELAKRDKVHISHITEGIEKGILTEDQDQKWKLLALNYPTIFIELSKRLGNEIDDRSLTQIASKFIRVSTNSTSEILRIEPDTKSDKEIPKEKEDSIVKTGPVAIEKQLNPLQRSRNKALRHLNSLNNENREPKQVMEKTEIKYFLKQPINYYSKSNLQDSHKSTDLQQYRFFLDSSGSRILCASAEDNLISAKIMIYDPNYNHIEALYLDTNQRSSLTIWNACAYLYLDCHLANRLSNTFKKGLENCLLYTDLRESCLKDGKTRGLAVFYPLFKTTNSLMSRAAIADESGIYLIGGSKISNGKIRRLLFSNECDYYELDAILKEPNLMEPKQEEEKVNNAHLPKIEGGIMSMNFKRSNLTVAQKPTRIFVADQISWDFEKDCFNDELFIEIFDKDLFKWVRNIKVPLNRPSVCSYQLASLENDKSNKKILIIENRIGEGPTGYVLVEEEGSEKIRLQKIEIGTKHKEDIFLTSGLRI